MKKFIYTVFMIVAVFFTAKGQQYNGPAVSKTRLMLDITNNGGVQFIQGAAGVSLIGLGSGGSGSQLVSFLKNSITLPVTLSSFNVNKKSDNVVLSWSTASEKNFSHFEILRSVNGTIFNKLYDVYSKGNVNNFNSYSFVDFSPVSGVNYYKLKMVDLDGTFKESKILSANFILKNDKIIVSVNKDKELIDISYNSLVNENGEIAVFSISGVKLFSENKQFVLGDNSFSLPLASTNTVLVVSISTQTQKQVVKILY